MKRRIMLWGCIPVLNALYQLFIKLAAEKMDHAAFGVAWLKQALLTHWMWAACASELAAFVLWMHILSTYDLGKAFLISAISYILVLCTGWFVFHEPILPLQLVGSALILVGVGLIGGTGKKEEGI